MFHISFMICIYLLPTIADSEKEPNTSRSITHLLSDPIGLIMDFLSNTQQMSARLVSHSFNSYSRHHRIQERMDIIREFAESAIIRGTLDAYEQTLVHLHRILRFNKYYLRSWPSIVRRCIHQRRGDLTTNNTLRFMYALDIYKPVSARISDFLIRLLVCSSQKIFKHLFRTTSVSADKLKFNLFVYEAIWKFMANRDRNKSVRLPDLCDIYYLDVNTDLYKREICFLNELLTTNGLILWDPELLETRWVSDHEHFELYLSEFLCVDHLCRGYNDSDFVWYFRITFVLKLLENSEYEIQCIPANSGYLDFENIVFFSVRYLWNARKWRLLDRFLFALHRNRGLSILAQPRFLNRLSEDNRGELTSIHFLMLCQELIPNEYAQCNLIAQSMFFWFSYLDKEEAMEQISPLFGADETRSVEMVDLLIRIMCSVRGFSHASKLRFLNLVIERHVQNASLLVETLENETKENISGLTLTEFF